MLKKLLSFDNPVIVNIFVLTFLCMLLFMVLLSPVVIITLISNPNVFEEADAAVLGANATAVDELLLTLRNFLEFFWIGDLIEFIRRKRHFKFKFFDDSTVPFLKYAIVGCLLYIALLLIK